MDVFSNIQAARAGGPAVSAPAAAGATLDRAAARKAAEAFESQFLGQMFQLAMQDMPVDEVFGGGPGEKMFRGMLTDAWAESAVKSGGVGLADSIMTEIIRMQGEQTT